MIAAVPPELVAGAVALVVILALARWGWNARKEVGRIRAWLEQAKREQEGRERFDAELGKKSGKAGARALARQRERTRRLRDKSKR